MSARATKATHDMALARLSRTFQDTDTGKSLVVTQGLYEMGTTTSNPRVAAS